MQTCVCPSELQVEWHVFLFHWSARDYLEMSILYIIVATYLLTPVVQVPVMQDAQKLIIWWPIRNDDSDRKKTSNGEFFCWRMSCKEVTG